jgi:hypothetical protein
MAHTEKIFAHYRACPEFLALAIGSSGGPAVAPVNAEPSLPNSTDAHFLFEPGASAHRRNRPPRARRPSVSQWRAVSVGPMKGGGDI